MIKDNIFDRAAYRTLHIVAKEKDSLPKMRGNTYIQTLGYALGQFGAYETENGVKEIPENVVFDENAEKTIVEKIGDSTAKVYSLER